ncbi:MAG TPA: glutamyl-tRNA reductase [Armatimonadota bacterium]|nr:glutamyl-tRNA reductase [Armatimonadota bacterium]
MTLVTVGFNHNTAPIELRERLAFGASSAAEISLALQNHCSLTECAILSTCNRSEIYAVGTDCQAQDLVRFLAGWREVDSAELQSHSYEYREADAVRHLCRVAAGLDSMVLGEHQVLKQVKDAADQAVEAHTSGPVLGALFRQAVTAGRRARSETAISRGAVSISHAAVELARQIFGQLAGCRALVLGAGEMGEITLKLLRSAGMRTSIMISNRTRERAEELAQRCDGVGIEWDQFPAALAEVDIVIVSTSAPHYIVKADIVRQAMRARRGRHILLVDISVPRNVDPVAGALPDVFLYNIDDLRDVAHRNLGDRAQEVEKVEQIIAEEVERFRIWQNGLGVAPAIVGMRQFAENVRQQEWDRLENKLAHLPEHDRVAIEAWTHQFINKLLHQPMVQLKALGVNGKGYDRVEVVRELFGLQEPAAVSSAAEAPGTAAKAMVGSETGRSTDGEADSC